MMLVERIAKEIGGRRWKILRSALVIVYVSSWEPDMPHAKVIHNGFPREEDTDLDL
jgi:hypothetical protein